MPLTLAYVNEVLNHLPCTVVVTESQWPELVRQLKFEGRPLEDLVIGRMRLRWAPGGYDGLLQRLEELTRQRDALQQHVKELEDADRSAETSAEATTAVCVEAQDA